MGGATLGLTTSNPERARQSRSGSFGSVNAAVGLLPGMELVGRLAFDGDLDCNMYNPGCDSSQRDLSVSGKYQLPVRLPLETRLAVGFTDVGGAATNYRQLYGVATSTQGPIDVSLGYSRAQSPQALMDGFFGSAVVRMTERWAAVLENDSREWRSGVHYTQPLTQQLSVQAGLSRKLSDRTIQQPWQATLLLNMALGSKESRKSGSPASEEIRPKEWSVQGPLNVAGPEISDSSEVYSEADSRASQAIRQNHDGGVSADAIAVELVNSGFTNVSVKYWPGMNQQAGLWLIQAEPRVWRQSHMDGLGVAIARWLKAVSIPGRLSDDTVVVTLTYQNHPVLHASTTQRCLGAWLNGWYRCQAENRTVTPVRFSRTASVPVSWMGERVETEAVQVAKYSGGASWAPQIELSPGLRTTVGTEYGLFDYSLALETGVEVGLAPGLFWQGVHSTPVSHSDDFSNNRIFSGKRHGRSGWDTQMLSYWRPLPFGFAAQASVGQFSRTERGGQLDAYWASSDGTLRFSGVVGRYESELDLRIRNPVLGAVRYSMIPGAWHIEVMAGKFMGADEGFKIMSSHWLGDVRMSLYYRKTASPYGVWMPERKFMGFEVSLPLGGKTATRLDSVTVRGRDRVGWGLETKVGENDNYLTAGYGLIPRIRHGLTSDVMDHDRLDAVISEEGLSRLKSVIQAH